METTLADGADQKSALPVSRAGPSRAGPGTRDLTTGPVGRTLILFALPVLGANALQSLNGSANAIWVSHVLGEAALTATANANQIFFLMLGAVFGIGMAANILIGQAIGAGDPARAKAVVGTATTFFIGVSLLVGMLGAAFTPQILTAMGTPADARLDAIIYLRVIFAAMPFIYFFAFLMIAQRGAGDSRTPFYFSLMSVALDVVMNPLLIMGIGPFPKLGIAGSAASTLISQLLTLAAMLTYLYRTGSIIVIRPKEWRLLVPNLQLVRTLLVKGLPMAFQMVVLSLAAVTMISFVNAYGSHTAAAYGAAIQLWTYVQMPGMAIGAAVSSMAAQNVGARRMDRVGLIARVGIIYSALLTGTPILILYLLDPWILRAFLPGGSPSLPMAVHINSIVIWGFVPFGAAFVFSGVVRSTGAVWPPLLAMLIALWGVRVPFATLLQPTWGQDAIWWSFPVGSTVTCILAGAYYRWGGWRNARMTAPVSPRGDAPDTGLSPPGGMEETEVTEAAVEDAARSPL
jgi:putative MATE family efflux protein